MTRILLVPGLDASPAPHWQHWWAASDPNALIADLPDPQRPDATLWETELAGLILIHPGCVLVGHSLGSVLITRLLLKWPHLKIRAALLVAPAEPAASSRIGSFAPLVESRLPVPTTLVASRNDPWMDYERARHLAKAWGSQLIDLGAAGHVNVASGFGPWPTGKTLADALIQRSAPMQADEPHIKPREVSHALRWI